LEGRRPSKKPAYFLAHCGGFAAAVSQKIWGGENSPNPTTV
jgi:hypothetical protein